MKRHLLIALSLPLIASSASAQIIQQPAPKVTKTATGFNLDWQGINDYTYFIQYSTDLTAWSYMPVIESGADAPLGYGFSFPNNKLFLRLHYTDTPTSNARDDDFDGDGISNWNEVRTGGLGTDPFNPDSNGNGIPDGIEDSDGDGTSNYNELLAGTNPNVASEGGREDPNVDTDGDGINNAFDADHVDKAVAWKRTPETSYAVINIGKPSDYNEEDFPTLHRLGEGNHVLISWKKYDVFTWSENGPIAKDKFLTYVWDISTASWSQPLELPNHLRGIGSTIDAEGTVYGLGYGGLGSDKKSPETKQVTLRWLKQTNGWAVADTETEKTLGTAFNPEGGGAEEVDAVLVVSPVIFGKTGRFICHSADFIDEDSSTLSEAYMYRLGVGNDTSFIQTDGYNNEISNYSQAGEPQGWHAATWSKKTDSGTEKKYIFSQLKNEDSSPTLADNIPPSEPARWNLDSLASIAPAYLPAGTHDIVIWKLNNGDFQVGSRSGATGALSWKASTKSNNDPEKLGGKINARGEGLKGQQLWRNGKWTNLSNLVDKRKWTNIRGLDINSNGLILAKTDEVVPEDQQGKTDELILLLPVEIRVTKESEVSAPEAGLIVKKTDIVRYRFSPSLPDFPVLFENNIQWYWRILKWDGTYGNWTAYAKGKGHTFAVKPKDAGIYEVKATVNGTDFFLKRKIDDPYSKKKKGSHDCFGVVDKQWQIEVRREAKRNLGSKKYSYAASNPPLPKNSWKCNLFVAHKATDGGATVPWINGGRFFVGTKYPPVANQWSGTEAKNIPNWTLLERETYPQPGWVVARGKAGGTGHAGIIGYDGAWISAGRTEINRKADSIC